MNGLFEDAAFTTLTAKSEYVKQVENEPVPTGKRTDISMDTQYLLLDLNDRRWSRANNVLGCILSVIAIIFFIQRILKK